MEKIKNSSIYPIVFMIVMAAILTFLLAALHEFTAPRVAFNEELDIRTKILDVFQIEVDNESVEAINSTFEENVNENEFKGAPMYIYQDENGQDLAYAVPFAGPGLWGRIQGYVGVSSDLSTIAGIQFTDQSETPGLGARIEEEEYRDQFRGIDISDADPGQYVASEPQGQIDSISGATQTSDAVIDMVNNDLEDFIGYVKGGN